MTAVLALSKPLRGRAAEERGGAHERAAQRLDAHVEHEPVPSLAVQLRGANVTRAAS
jgi:hypothetical protein